jgi:AcrR family transcriptional regulator
MNDIKNKPKGMKRHEHRNALKRRVLEVSRSLFLEKGYSKTTINEITHNAGITTGSLYHFFKSKDDILLHLTQEVFEMAAAMADALLGEEGAPWLRFALEIGIQLYFTFKYKAVAELYLAAHESADIARMIAQSARDRNQKLFQSICPEFTPDDYHATAIATKGIFHSFVQEAVHNQPDISLPSMFRSIEMMLTLYQIPKTEIKNAIKETMALLQKSHVKLYHFEVP